MLSLDELTAMIEAKGKKSLNEERLLILAAVVRAEQATFHLRVEIRIASTWDERK